MPHLLLKLPSKTVVPTLPSFIHLSRCSCDLCLCIYYFFILPRSLEGSRNSLVKGPNQKSRSKYSQTLGQCWIKLHILQCLLMKGLAQNSARFFLLCRVVQGGKPWWPVFMEAVLNSEVVSTLPPSGSEMWHAHSTCDMPHFPQCNLPVLHKSEYEPISTPKPESFMVCIQDCSKAAMLYFGGFSTYRGKALCFNMALSGGGIDMPRVGFLEYIVFSEEYNIQQQVGTAKVFISK